MRHFMLMFSVAVSLFWLLLPQVIYVLSFLVGRVVEARVHWRPFAWSSALLLTLWWGIYAYGHWVGRFCWEVKRWTYTDFRVPETFDGYRIVHISDLHLDGWLGQEHRLEQVVRDINALKPDLICFTGDLVSFDYRELQPLLPVLRQLQARDGVVSIMGNHDYDPYERGIGPALRASKVQRLEQMERDSLGWQLLLNQHVVLHRGGDSIAVAGVENQSCGAHNVVRRGRLGDALRGTEGLFTILLSHDPSHWRAEVLGRTDVPLMLSGHTHAMQVRVLGFTPCKWIYPECDGCYEEGHQTLYVNIGLGGTLPMRIGARPEITLLTLQSV